MTGFSTIAKEGHEGIIVHQGKDMIMNTKGESTTFELSVNLFLSREDLKRLFKIYDQAEAEYWPPDIDDKEAQGTGNYYHQKNR